MDQMISQQNLDYELRNLELSKIREGAAAEEGLEKRTGSR